MSLLRQVQGCALQDENGARCGHLRSDYRSCGSKHWCRIHPRSGASPANSPSPLPSANDRHSQRPNAGPRRIAARPVMPLSLFADHPLSRCLDKLERPEGEEIGILRKPAKPGKSAAGDRQAPGIQELPRDKAGLPHPPIGDHPGRAPPCRKSTGRSRIRTCARRRPGPSCHDRLPAAGAGGFQLDRRIPDRLPGNIGGGKLFKPAQGQPCSSGFGRWPASARKVPPSLPPVWLQARLLFEEGPPDCSARRRPYSCR